MRFTIAGAVAVARAKPGRMAAIGGEGEEVVGVSKAVSTCDVTITIAGTPDNCYVVINGGVGPQGAQGEAGAAGAAGQGVPTGGQPDRSSMRKLIFRFLLFASQAFEAFTYIERKRTRLYSR